MLGLVSFGVSTPVPTPRQVGIEAAAQARRLGHTRYFTGIPCPKGHVAQRLVRDGNCAECSRLRRARRRANNPEHFNAISNACYHRNKHQYLERDKEYRARPAVREKKLDYMKRWHKLNPDGARASSASRRARTLSTISGGLTDRELASVVTMYYWLARCRTRVTGVKHELDHINPLRGKENPGSHCLENLQILTKQQNAEKSNRQDYDGPCGLGVEFPYLFLDLAPRVIPAEDACDDWRDECNEIEPPEETPDVIDYPE